MVNKAILVVDDEPQWQQVHHRLLKPQGMEMVQTTKLQEARYLLEQRLFAFVAIADQLAGINGIELLREIKHRSPITPVMILTNRATVDRAVEAMKLGAMDYVVKPLSWERLEETLALCGNNSEANQENEPSIKVKGIAEKKKRSIITRDPIMQRLLKTAQVVAPNRATVLLQGESGTGKELFARFIHAHSDRSEGPFVAVNCASLPEGLLESELFGHEKGAFTGALMRKLGKFELAQNGTLLLDEISEMHPQLQAKLLRVLQENEIDRVGGRQPVQVNVRVIATTNRDLAESIDKGEFREDLFYRLNVINITLPPLRQRRVDIPLLAEFFLNQYAVSSGKGHVRFSPSALATLEKASWRGNVRELENTVARGVLLSQGEWIGPEDLLPSAIVEQPLLQEAEPVSPLTLRDMERRMIFQALDETSGNRTNAAKILGISVRTLRNKLNEYKEGYL
jgi:two-component system response regulator FlrC